MTDIRVTPQRWLWQPRQKQIRMIEIHATRGNNTPEKQKPGALNWVQSRNNTNRDNAGNPLYEWGSSFSHVIGTDGSEGTVLDDNQMPTYSAGYGGAGSTYAIDEYAISYELAQSPAQEPFNDAIYDRLTTEVAIDCLAYGIPPVMIEIPRQTGAVPTGIVRHDKCENGIKLGKTDPGNQFDERRFIADVKAKMEDDMTDAEVNALIDKRLKLRLGGAIPAGGGQMRFRAESRTGVALAAVTTLKRWFGVVDEHRKDGSKHGAGGGGITEAKARAIAVAEDKKLKVTK